MSLDGRSGSVVLGQPNAGTHQSFPPAYIHTYTHTHTCMHACVPFFHLYTHTQHDTSFVGTLSVSVCLYICLYVCVCCMMLFLHACTHGTLKALFAGTLSTPHALRMLPSCGMYVHARNMTCICFILNYLYVESQRISCFNLFPRDYTHTHTYTHVTYLTLLWALCAVRGRDVLIGERDGMRSGALCIYIYACIYTYIHICMHGYIHTHVRWHA
jgi:hypothetical protein